jgi:hypothetical protein
MFHKLNITKISNGGNWSNEHVSFNFFFYATHIHNTLHLDMKNKNQFKNMITQNSSMSGIKHKHLPSEILASVRY